MWYDVMVSPEVQPATHILDVGLRPWQKSRKNSHTITYRHAHTSSFKARHRGGNVLDKKPVLEQTQGGFYAAPRILGDGKKLQMAI